MILSKFKYEDDKQGQFTIDLMPDSIRANLFPFQLQGVQFGLKKHGRFLLGDEMGVGKTI